MSYIVIRRPEVLNKTGLSRSTLYALISEGRFPKPINIGVKAVGWLEAEIDAWIEEKIKTRKMEG